MDASPDLNALIESLRMAGADRFDAVRLHYLEALAHRAKAHRGSVKRLLDARLADALATFTERFERARCDCNESMARARQQYPQAADPLQQLFVAGDFKAVQRLIASLETSEQHPSLGALVRQLEHQYSDKSEARPERSAGSPPELKTIRNFRNTWSKLSVDKQVNQALKQGPMNAGPINSHMLVLRSLAAMRDISPDYLNRFMSYADTLLRLDQREKERPARSVKPQGAKTVKNQLREP